MNRDWIEEKARIFSAEVAMEDADKGIRILFRELPGLLRERAVAFATKGMLITRRLTGFEHALDLLAAAYNGHSLFPTNPRFPNSRLQEMLVGWGGENIASELLKTGTVISASAPGEGTLLASSGSTGLPKLLYHPWSAHIANADGAAQRIPLHPGHRWLINLPLWHTSGFAAMFRTLHAGATAVFGSRAENITHRSVVATQLMRELGAGCVFPESLQVLLAGGGPVPSRLRQRALDAALPLHVTYGLTEAASQVCTTERLYTPTPEICGRLLPHREMKIEKSGEILLRGAVMAHGIWNHQLQVVEPLPVNSEGWWATRDIGKLNEHGEVLIKGRKDRMFVSAGENVHPERIEKALLELPGISQAVVLSIPDEEFGAVPVAFVDGKGEPDAWREMLQEKLSGLEIPKKWLAWPEGDRKEAMKPIPKEFEKFLHSHPTGLE